MATIDEFMHFVESLPSSVVTIHSNPALHQPALQTLDLGVLTNDIRRFGNLREWWKSKNMNPRLNKVVAQAILDQNPPEAVRDSLLFLMLW